MCKRKVRSLICFVLASVLLLSGMPAVQADAAEVSTQLYVSTNGSDTNDGTTVDTAFRTLEAARNKIREMKNNGSYPSSGVTVNICGGEYVYMDSFSLEEQDSGTEKAPVIYRAYNGEEVKIVGSTKVNGGDFEKVADESILNRLADSVKDKVVVYDLGTKLGMTNISPIQKNGFQWPAKAGSMTVLVDGEAQTLSRYPNDGFLQIASIEKRGFGVMDHRPRIDGSCETCNSTCTISDDALETQEGGVFTVGGTEIQNKYSLWSKETDIWTMGYFTWDWAEDHCAIKTLSETTSGIKIEMEHPTGYGVSGSDRKFYVYNMLCEIDQPGEYYVDRENKKLYLYPAKDITDSSIDLTVCTNPLVKMDNVKNVEWQNISFSKSNGHGIVMINCENVEIAGCKFSDLGQKAIVIGDPALIEFGGRHKIDRNIGINGGKNNTVRSCDITRTGQGGIYVGGGNRYTLEAGNNQVINCDISDFQVTKRTYTPAVELVGCGNSVIRNKIYNAPHSGIIFWGNDFLIEGNEIYNVCYETSDCGAIYTGRMWSSHGTVIKNNFIHDLYTQSGIGSAGVYVDDIGSGVTLTENLMANLTGRFILYGGGRDNVVTNNIMMNYSNGNGLAFDNRGMGASKKFAEAPYGETYMELKTLRSHSDYDKEEWNKKYPTLAALDLDNNYSATEAGKPAGNTISKNIVVGCSNPYREINSNVKNLGTFENNSVYEEGSDIGFANAALYDYTVKEDSIIKTIQGENHFDVSKMGLYTDEYRTVIAGSIDAPELLSPADEEFDVQAGISLNFKWEAVEAAGTYILEISKDENFETIEKTITTKEENALIDGLEADTKYYWRVKAVEDRINGAIGTSEVFSFTTSEELDNSFFEGFYDFDQWEVYDGGWSVVGKPSNTKTVAKSGIYSYEMNESTDAIRKVFSSKRNDVVSVWLYDNMNKGDRVAAIVNVTREAEDGSVPWIAVGVSDPYMEKYVVRGSAGWAVTEVNRTEGWHELKFDYTDGQTCKVYIDNNLVLTEEAPYYDRIIIGDLWQDNGKSGDISGICFDHLTVGDPEVRENVLSLSVPADEITLKENGTYQIEAMAETDPDRDVELEYVCLNNFVATVDENGLITAKGAGKAVVTVKSKNNTGKLANITVTVEAEDEVPEISKDALQKLYNEYKDYVKADYTEQSWKALEAAMIAADAELSSEASTTESVSVAMNTLKTAVDNLESVKHNISGDNLGFELGNLNGFEGYAEKHATANVVTDEKYEGSYSAKVTTKADTSKNYPLFGLRFSTTEISPEESYEISCYVKTENSAAKDYAIHVWLRGDNRANLGEITSASSEIAGEWTKLTMDLSAEQMKTVLDNKNKTINDIKSIEIAFGMENKTSNEGTFYIDKIEIAKKSSTSVAVTGISLDQTSASVNPGGTVELVATITPADATNDMIRWYTSDESIATVDNNGVVTAKKPGSVKVYAKALNNGMTAECTVTVSADSSVDKNELQTLYTNCQKLVEADYTEDSWNALETAMIAADKELSDWASTKESVKTAKDALETASTNLKSVMQSVSGNNLGFELGNLNGFENYPSNGKEKTEAEVVQDNPQEGQYCAKVTTNNNQDYDLKGLRLTLPKDQYNVGDKFTFSCYVKTETNENRKLGIAVWYRKADRTKIQYVPATFTEINGEWTLLTVDSQAVPEGTEILEVVVGTKIDDPGVFYMDNVCIYKKSDSTPIEVTEISLDPTSASVNPDETVDLKATITPENATNQMIRWYTSDESIATVDNSGKVTAIKPGIVTVYAKALNNDKTASCEITVVQPAQISTPVESVALDLESVDVNPNQVIMLNATVAPADAANKDVTWSTSNSSVATVENGKVTAVGAGEAVITVTTSDGGYTDTCTVKVNAATVSVLEVKLSKKNLTLTEEEEYTLAVKYYPENATDKSVTWSSSNDAIATVENGKVKAIAKGIATITVSTEDGKYTDTCTVTVNEKVKVNGVTISAQTLELTVGQEGELTASVAPTDAANKNVTWASSNDTIVTVDNGKVKAIAAGTAEVTVTTEDGAFTAKCTITVKEPEPEKVLVTGVEISKKSLKLTVGQEGELTATIAPADATNKNVTWISSDNAIVTVENSNARTINSAAAKNVKIKAVATGTAVVTVTTEDGAFTDSCVVTVVEAQTPSGGTNGGETGNQGSQNNKTDKNETEESPEFVGRYEAEENATTSASAGENPSTGDNANILVWVAVIAVALVGVCYCAKKKQKK